MPPSIPCALSRRAAQSIHGSTATATATATATSISSLSRAFSATSLRPTNQIPPESPAFINVPTPPLSQAIEDKKHDRFARKGHLPLPRRIFKRRTYELPKHDPVFLAQSAPAPTSAKSQLPPGSEHEARRRRMAENRRKNFNEGVTELWARKQATDRARLSQQASKLNLNRQQTNKAQRLDERFTETTIPAAVLQTHVPQDPERFDRALASQARTAAIAEAKAQDRKDALQHLYMSARSFIVDEAALEREVDRVFDPAYFSKTLTPSGKTSVNAWDMFGAPSTVRNMMGDVLRTDNKVINASDESTRTSKRQRRVAEELTGGPMDEV
ncbi:hypothetical protein JX265_012813 [Neoarthrinium moseri]|uniref:Uncharacterized protein n=1 Tax=Neoarthrinium moseri TaxID=1658444 RepID=A0A9P9W9Q1_9PEZI|nr:hypothetical protein JX265_012813 [Neoarthrinium moseri]